MNKFQDAEIEFYKNNPKPKLKEDATDIEKKQHCWDPNVLTQDIGLGTSINGPGATTADAYDIRAHWPWGL